MDTPQLDLETLIENGGRIEQTKEIDPIADIDAGSGGEAEKVVVTDEAKEDVAADKEESAEAPEAKEGESVVEADGEDTALDEALKAMRSSDEKPVWDEKAKEVFKKTFGADDPEAVLGELGTLRETVAQAEEKAKQSEKILANAQKLPYELAKAVEAALQGKDYKGLINELASGVTLSKASKDLDKVALVDRYYKGKFTQEDKEAIKSGDADEDLMERFNEYHGLASEKHDGARSKEQAAIEQAREAQKLAIEADKKSAMEAVAFAKNDPVVSKLMNELPSGVVDEYLSGALEEKQLYNPDGTRSKAGLALLVKGMLFDKAVTRAMKGAQAAARAEVKAKQHAGLPEKPSIQGSKRPDAKADKDGPKLDPSIQAVFDMG